MNSGKELLPVVCKLLVSCELEQIHLCVQHPPLACDHNRSGESFLRTLLSLHRSEWLACVALIHTKVG